MYDGLLNMNLPTGAQIIGYADDIALVITHTLPQAIEIIANDSLSRCDRWLSENGLKLAAEKTEAILITNRRKFKMPEIRIQDKSVAFSQSLQYLGVQMDCRMNFKPHVQNIRDKAIKTANVLARIMPNNGGPKDSTRRLINSVIHSQMLYAAPILSSAIKRKSVTGQLIKPQRMGALRVISGYRTISTSAALVLASIPPIDLLLLEREEIYQKLTTDIDLRSDTIYREQVKKEARDTLITRWQERWDRDDKGRWTYRLIPDIRKWIERKHGEMNYYFTQIMTGHGNFNKYLERFNIKDSAVCDDCGFPDDNPEHVIFHCSKWENTRKSLNEAIGVILTPENIVHEMIASEGSWKQCQDFIFRIMKYRCHRTTEPLSSDEDGGVGFIDR